MDSLEPLNDISNGMDESCGSLDDVVIFDVRLRGRRTAA